MKQVTIGIIGGTGGIGRWFAGFFRAQGFTVHVSGRTSGMDMAALARTCQIVIVSVPIHATVGVIKKIGPLMKRDSLLMDLTSLKEAPVKAMLAASRSEVIGCHPLFGPAVRTMKNQNIVLCPGRGKQWRSRLITIFEKAGARLIETTPEDHDEMMAVVQGLSHFNTMALALAIRKSGIDRNTLKAFSTPIFRDKLRHIDKVFSNPGLYSDILTGNPAFPELAGRYEDAVRRLRHTVGKKDGQSLRELIDEKHLR